MTGLMVSMMAFVAGVKDKLESEKGATATEYGLLVGLIALAIVIGVTAFGGATFFGGALDAWFRALGAEINTWRAP